MIYFLQIKNTGKIDCKFYFKTEEGLRDYMVRKLPLSLHMGEQKYEAVQQEDGTFKTVLKDSEDVLKGQALETFLEKCIEIIMIDETICYEYRKLFKGEFYGEG